MTPYAPGELVQCRPVGRRPFLATVVRCDSAPGEPSGVATVHVAVRYSLGGTLHPQRGMSRALFACHVRKATPAQVRHHLAVIGAR